MPHFLPDTRPYPTDAVKNELLLHATAAAVSHSKAQKTLAEESIQALLYQMLQQKQLLALSVALSMVPDATVYRVLWQAMNDVLRAKTDNEITWLALPVVLVAGCNQTCSVSGQLDAAALSTQLHKFTETSDLATLSFLPHWVSAEQMASVSLGDWFAAKQSAADAAAFANRFTAAPIAIPEGQSVHVVYALAYGGDVAPRALGQAALPMMQFWQETLSTHGLTLFANPLDPALPLNAISNGSHMRQRMALDVFAANAIRAIRLQDPRVGVVAAAQEGGRLAFSFNTADPSSALAAQTFYWSLSPTDNVDIIMQDFIDLMAECRIEHLRLLHEPLAADAPPPDYPQALHLTGFNPFFTTGH